MRIGIVSDESTFGKSGERYPLPNLCNELVRRGHIAVCLQIENAEMVEDRLVYKEVDETRQPEHLDSFFTWLPVFQSLKAAWSTPKIGQKVSYFDQVKYLSERMCSPTPFSAQMITNDKYKMKDLFTSISVPHPITWDGDDAYVRQELLRIHFNDAVCGKPLVMKPKFGWAGNNVHKLENVGSDDVQEWFDLFDSKEASFILQEYIEGNGADYRAFVIEDRVVAGIKRQAAEGDWRGNFSKGSSVSPYKFTPEQERDAVAVMQAAELAFGAVDILIDPNTGEHYICEINDNAGVESIEKAHPGLKIASLIADMLEARYALPQPSL